MKKILPVICALAFIGAFSAYGQSELIIDEDFQMWDPTEDTNLDTCGKGEVTEYKLMQEMDLLTSSGTEQIKVKMTACAIAPECNSRRFEDSGGATPNTPGVTTGYVQLKKLSGDFEYNTVDDWELSIDTLGEFIFGPIPQLDSIKFAHSNTGSQRGIRIYISFDGETWERPTEDEYWDGADCQAGDVNTCIIKESDVFIKFTAGFKQSDGTSQFSRLHNIQAWGTPGEYVGIKNVELAKLKILSLGDGKFQFASEMNNIRLYNTVGALIYRSKESISTLDLSSYSSGIYVIRANDRYGKEYVEKFYR